MSAETNIDTRVWEYDRDLLVYVNDFRPQGSYIWTDGTDIYY